MPEMETISLSKKKWIRLFLVARVLVLLDMLNIDLFSFLFARPCWFLFFLLNTVVFLLDPVTFIFSLDAVVFFFFARPCFFSTPCCVFLNTVQMAEWYKASVS